MMISKLSVVVTIILVHIAIGVIGTSNGAGSCLATQDDMDFFKEHHGDARYPGVTGDTSIQFSAEKFVPGCTYTITTCGPAYNGFLLAARDMMTNVPKGAFTDPSTGAYNGVAKLQTCNSVAGAAVTHVMPTQRTSPMHFTWKAPLAGAADMHFYLTTVRLTQDDWYHIEKMFEMDTTSSTCPTVPATNPCPADGASNTAATHDHSMSVMNMDMNMGTMQMQMVMKFSTGWSGINMVFPNWVINTKTGYVGACIVVLLLAILMEWGTTMSGRVDRYFMAENAKKLKNEAAAVVATFAPTTNVTVEMVNVAPEKPIGATPAAVNAMSSSSVVPAVIESPLRFTNCQHMCRTLLKCALQFLSLFLMIVFMILDVGLCCCLMAGYALGFYSFGRQRGISSGEHC